MKKTQNLSKKQPTKKPPLAKQKLAIIILSIAVTILTITSVISYLAIYYIWRYETTSYIPKITTLILQAIDGFNSPIPIDATTGKAYIYQSKLVLPAKKDSIGQDLEYLYSSSWDDNPEELRIANKFGQLSARTQIISAQTLEQTFEAVPKLQACTRGYSLFFTPQDNSPDKFVFTKQLTDGRNLYVYLDSGCQESNQDFEDYLKQIDSY